MNIDVLLAELFDEFSSHSVQYGAHPSCRGRATGKGHLAFPLWVEKVVQTLGRFADGHMVRVETETDLGFPVRPIEDAAFAFGHDIVAEEAKLR